VSERLCVMRLMQKERNEKFMNFHFFFAHGKTGDYFLRAVAKKAIATSENFILLSSRK
jgi:triphosphoribosyl-dephospho-CoA synthetase